MYSQTGKRLHVGGAQPCALSTSGEHAEGRIGKRCTVERMLIDLIDGKQMEVCMLLLQVGGQMAAQSLKAR